MSSASRSRAVLVALRTWLLPVALGAGAFGLHYALHVPPGPLPPPSPTVLEEQKKQADKEKRDAERKQKEADRKAGKVRAPERSGVRDLPYEPFNRPRSEFILAQLRDYYLPKSFKSEPTFEAWQTAHKVVIGQLVSAGRVLALPTGPTITVASSECHTIRCRFTVSSPTPESLTTRVDLLKTLELDGKSLWHSFKPGKLAEEPAKREGAELRHKQEIVVVFLRDLPPLDRIEAPGKGRLRPLATPPVPPPGTTPTPGTSTPGKPGKLGPTGAPITGTPGKPSSTPSPTGAAAPDPTPK